MKFEQSAADTVMQPAALRSCRCSRQPFIWRPHDSTLYRAASHWAFQKCGDGLECLKWTL